MTPAQAAYRAGMIVAELDARFGLTESAVNNSCTLPNRLPVILRHVWAKGLKVPEVADLVDGFSPPDAPYPLPEQGSFWLGFYGQKLARGLPATFPERLRALRATAELSVAALAARAGLVAATLRMYEAGTRRPGWDAVQALAAALGVTTDTFRDKHV